MLFGKRGKSGLVALNLDLAEVAGFVKERLGKEVPFLFCPPNLRTIFCYQFFLVLHVHPLNVCLYLSLKCRLRWVDAKDL
jgi:succinyl-CoA synthetase beta subunit